MNDATSNASKLAQRLEQLQNKNDRLIALLEAHGIEYGSVAKKTDTAGSDIDLMLLSDEISYGELFSGLENVSTLLGRTVNPTILTHEEFKKRLTNQESFLTRILEKPKIWIIGGSNDLGI